MPVRVVTAEESAERDREAIDAGTPSRGLMQRAGTAAAEQIMRRFGELLNHGVTVFTGPGNNGGDGWVVAGHLARAGFQTVVFEAEPARAPDAILERAVAMPSLSGGSDTLFPRVAVDALLGTGFRGEPRGSIAEAIATIKRLRGAGVRVVSLDVPSGLDATTGDHAECVRADVTVSFGGVKRGTLLARDVCGEIVALDIGLPDSPALPLLIDRAWVSSRLPRISYDAHKGERRHLAIVGGGKGMAGAAVLATRAALRSGIGVVRTAVASENTGALTGATPSALITEWPEDTSVVQRDFGDWAHALVIGPGLGRSKETRRLVERILAGSRCPILLDADALNVFTGDATEFRDMLAGRPALLTPHAAEFARLANTDVKTVLGERFDIGSTLAATLGATILLKGAPTVIFSPAGARLVSARGTAALAAGGSGDLLAGVAGTLLAQTGDAVTAAGCSAWVHGRAAELCGHVRGTTLEDVLYSLPRAWNEEELTDEPPVMTSLPAVTV